MIRFPTIISHRGLHRGTDFPENSLPAFEATWGSGVAWCECDVHVTRDRRVVVIHDDTLDRTTTGTGDVRFTWYQSLARERLTDASGARTNYNVPLLTEVLHSMPAGCGMLIEMKADMPSFHHVARVMIARGWKVGLQSFDPQNLVEICEAGLNRKAFLLAEDLRAVPEAVRLGCAGINLRHDLIDAKLVRRLTDLKLSVGAWTANSETDIERLARAGVDMIITDEPLLAKQVVGRVLSENA